MKHNPVISLSSLLLFGLLTYSVKTFAQTQPANPITKKIEVTGSAEMEVTPDEIYFSVSLREYLKDNKNKVDIETLEKQLQTAVNAAGVPKEDFQIEDIYGNRWYWQQKKKPADFLASKRYVLKLSDLAKVDGILSKIDAKGIESINVTRYEHSKIEQFRRELKTKALQAAKEKAAFLLQGIGEQIGGVMEISEMGGEDGNYPIPYPAYARASNEMMMNKQEDMAETSPAIDFKKIKLRYEMRAVFAIK